MTLVFILFLALTLSSCDTRALARLSFFSDLASSATFCSFSVNSESNACCHIRALAKYTTSTPQRKETQNKQDTYLEMDTVKYNTCYQCLFVKSDVNYLLYFQMSHAPTFRCSSHFSLRGGVRVRVAQIRWCATRWVTCMWSFQWGWTLSGWTVLVDMAALRDDIRSGTMYCCTRRFGGKFKKIKFLLQQK